MANTTMMGIISRMVAYSGQSISWEEAMNSNKVIGPSIDEYSWELKWPNGEIAVPGTTQVL
jgi:hypothetical protein